MQLPYLILGASEFDDDATLRGRYLALVQQFPPSREGERFAEISASYEAVKDAPSRARQSVLGATRFSDASVGLAALRRAAARALPTLATLAGPESPQDG